MSEGSSLPSGDEVMDEAVAEEVLLDENVLAERSKSFDLGGFEVCDLAPVLQLLPCYQSRLSAHHHKAILTRTTLLRKA